MSAAGSRERSSVPSAVAPELKRLNSSLDANLRFEVVRDTRPFSRGVLVDTGEHGVERRASFPVLANAPARTRLHSLARSLSECAMALGLGAGIYEGIAGGRVRVARCHSREST